jgi:isochorismate pyruvate lyase
MENAALNRHVRSMEKPDPLHDLRKEIDTLDRALIELLAQRERLVERVLLVKKAENLPGRIQSRVDTVVGNACKRATEVGMNPDLARTVWSAMVEWFVQHEEKRLTQKP